MIPALRAAFAGLLQELHPGEYATSSHGISPEALDDAEKVLAQPAEQGWPIGERPQVFAAAEPGPRYATSTCDR